MEEVMETGCWFSVCLILLWFLFISALPSNDPGEMFSSDIEIEFGKRR